MGWCSGSRIFEEIWEFVRPHIKESERVEVCRQMIVVLQGHDWDCEGDFIGDERFPEFDEAIRILESGREEKRFILGGGEEVSDEVS